MRGFKTSARGIWPVGLVVLGGCIGQPGAIEPPRMPRVVAGPPAAARTALNAGDVLARAVDAAGRDDVAGAVRAVMELPADDRHEVMRELVARVAQQDPFRAGRLALAVAADPVEVEPVRIAVKAMLERNPDAAVQWALARPEPAGGFAARQILADELLERGASAAMARVLALPVSEERNNFLGLLAARWARRDAGSALAWARGLRDGELKIRALTSAGFEIARTSPERAVEVVDALPAGRDRSLLLGAIGQTWVARDADAAWAWARQLPAGDARMAAIAGIETGLGGAAPLSSSVGAIAGAGGPPARAGSGRPPPPGLERDDALRHTFEEKLQQSPRLAADWLTSLPPPDRSEEMLARLTREWLVTDPAAARNWLRLNVPTNVEREQLLQEAKR